MDDEQLNGQRSSSEGAVKPRGRPFLKGKSGNPTGKAKIEEPDSKGGIVTAARMRKVLAQPKVMDCSPTERELRKWLDKDVKGYLQAADDRERQERGDGERDAELKRLRAEVAESSRRSERVPDEGSARAEELILRTLRCPIGEEHRQG